MQFGWLTLGLSPSPDEDAAAIDEAVTQACFAETAGFDGIWLTEHNFTGESVYCDPIPFASVVAARTSRIRIGFAVLQLALRHPIRLATQLALLDNLSGGRLDVGVGHGTNYNEYEFVGFGLRSDDSRARMEETLEVMVRAWTEAPLVHHGKFYQLSLPALRPRPRQLPYPPVWRAVSSAASVRDCGRLGAPILMARIPHRPRPRTPRALRHRPRRERSRRHRPAPSSGTSRALALRPRRREPRPGRRRAGRRTPRHPSSHGARPGNAQPGRLPRRRLPPQRLDRPQGLRRGRRSLRADLTALYGTAAQVAEQVAALRDAGVHHLLCQMSVGYLPHDKILDSMRRFGEQVRPRFQS